MKSGIVAMFLVLNLTTPSADAAEERRRAVRHPSPPAQVFLLEERTAGSVFSMDTFCSASDRWSIDHNELLRQFSTAFANTDYDFLVLFPTKSLCYNYSLTANQNITGIGACTVCTNSLAPNLKAFAVIDLFASWKVFTDYANDPERLVPVFLDVTIHEVGHYWLVHIQGLETGDGIHWPNNLDLFDGDSRYVDPMSYYQWIVRNGQETCVDGGDAAVTRKFSDLSLYLMGLAPPEAVAPIAEHTFATKPENQHYNTWGPDCRDTHSFLATRALTVQDIVARNGVRAPPYPEAQRNFRIAFVIVTAKGEPIPQGFIDYIKSFKDGFPQAWSRATGSRSEMVIVPVIDR